MKYFILSLLIFFMIKWIFYKKKINKSLLSYINYVNNFIKKNNFNINRIIEFNRFYRYKKKKISFGAILFDDINKQLIIYETFIYKKKKVICIPDIRLFKYSDINKCLIRFNNENIDINKIYSNNLNRIMIYIETLDEVFNISFLSVNDLELFKMIYYEIVMLINNKEINI